MSVIAPLPKIELLKPCANYQQRVLEFDPKPIYERCDVNHFARFQTLGLHNIFPKTEDGLCGCGCKKELTGRKTRWATQECTHFAVDVFYIIQGNALIIEQYLTLYYGQCACIECGLTDAYWENKAGHMVNAIQKDHIIPVHQGGGGCWLSNYQFLCEECHQVKSISERQIKSESNLNPTT